MIESAGAAVINTTVSTLAGRLVAWSIEEKPENQRNRSPFVRVYSSLLFVRLRQKQGKTKIILMTVILSVLVVVSPPRSRSPYHTYKLLQLHIINATNAYFS